MPTLAKRMFDKASNVLLTAAEVSEVTRHPSGFVRVGLRAEEFRDATWTPGEKIQFRTSTDGMGMRTYTPITWDTHTATTQLIAYVHGTGPASDWFRRVTAGTTCEMIGPRRSLDLSGADERVVFVGDESSVGLACALSTVTSHVGHVFEANDAEALTAALRDFQLDERSTVLPKGSDTASLAREIAESDNGAFDLVVTGDARTVHTLRRAARGWARPPRGIRARAYWAEGRTALD